MDLLQMKYFATVAQTGNVTRAAELLNIAQPSLSTTIARLENDLGVPLFDRRGRRIVLNQFGKSFLQRVRHVFRELDEGRRELADMAGLDFGVVTIGTTTSQIVPDIFGEFMTLHPNVRFKLFQVGGKLEIPNKLANGEIDFCISSLPIEHPIGKLEIDEERLTTEEIYLAVPPMHRLAGKRSIRLGEVKNEKFISYTQEEGFRDIINGFCQQSDFLPNVVFESSSTETICRLVRTGVGIAFLPSFWWNAGLTDGLIRLRIAGHALTRSIRLSWLKGRYLSLAAQDFRTFITNYFA